MRETQSLLYRSLASLRTRLDASASGRYDDAALLREFLLPCYGEVITDLQMVSQLPVLMLWPFSVTSSTRSVILPPNVNSVWRIGRLDSSGSLTNEIAPDSEWSPAGPQWHVIGNELTFRPYPTQDEDWLLFYEPSGCIFPHAGTGTVASDNTIVLAETPLLGELDWRPNAYAGAYLRILEDDCAVQERLIESYDVETRTATLRSDFDDLGSVSIPSVSADVDYEVVPFLGEAFHQVILAKAALMLGPVLGLTEKRIMSLEYEKDVKVKALRDQQSTFVVQRSKEFKRFTYRNPNFNNPEGVILYGGASPWLSWPRALE